MTPLQIIELPHVFGDVAGQLAQFDRTPIEKGALVAFTGYVSARGDFDLTRFAEALDGPLATALRARAQQHGIFLVAPIVERSGTHCYNTTLVYAPDGTLLTRYRKRHPWYPETWATPGENPHPVLQIGEYKAMLAVCFDVHFLRDEADAALKQADLLIFPSAWVEEDIDSRDTLLPALANDYALTVMNPNWGPGVPRFATQGGSRIVQMAGSGKKR
jgi:5-aminopentanamidase